MCEPIPLTGDRRQAINESVGWMITIVEKLLKAKTFTKDDAVAVSYNLHCEALKIFVALNVKDEYIEKAVENGMKAYETLIKAYKT